VATSPSDEDYGVLRVDYAASDKTSLFARYVRDPASAADPWAGAGGALPLWGAVQVSANLYATVDARRIPPLQAHHRHRPAKERGIVGRRQRLRLARP